MLVKNKKLEGIAELRDESDREGIRVVIELKKEAYPQKVLNRLYKLTQLQENIQKFQQDAQASIQNKQDQLMSPVFAKVGKAIEDVAKEQGYSFIINPQLIGGGDILLYSDEKYDISDLVLKKMGVTPKPAANKTN